MVLTGREFLQRGIESTFGCRLGYIYQAVGDTVVRLVAATDGRIAEDSAAPRLEKPFRRAAMRPAPPPPALRAPLP